MSMEIEQFLSGKPTPGTCFLLFKAGT
jgi:hypothetical protein